MQKLEKLNLGKSAFGKGRRLERKPTVLVYHKSDGQTKHSFPKREENIVRNAMFNLS